MALFPFDLSSVSTPAFVCDLQALEANLRRLAAVQQAADCKILLALKGFAMWGVADLIRKYLPGTTASSVHEARLGREEFGGEVHVCAPAYSRHDFLELLKICDHIVINTPDQLTRWLPLRDAYAERTGQRVSLGLRINPEHREVEVPLYDPCAPCSRLGTTLSMLGNISSDLLAQLDGLHFHTLCELNSDALERTLSAVESHFSPLLSRISWLNMGGGHHITRPDYDIQRLVRLIQQVRDRWNVEVYLEPGEAIGLNTGVLVSEVLDTMHNGMDIAILDTSATAHMPDVLEMPYRPRVWIEGTELIGGHIGDHPHAVRLGGLSCLAGDVIGDYSFERPLRVGDRLVFDDMIHYTMVKTTTFNGVRLPSIVLADQTNPGVPLRVLRSFGYEDYKHRLS